MFANVNNGLLLTVCQVNTGRQTHYRLNKSSKRVPGRFGTLQCKLIVRLITKTNRRRLPKEVLSKNYNNSVNKNDWQFQSLQAIRQHHPPASLAEILCAFNQTNWRVAFSLLCAKGSSVILAKHKKFRNKVEEETTQSTQSTLSIGAENLKIYLKNFHLKTCESKNRPIRH